jgi:hypothetical protein
MPTEQSYSRDMADHIGFLHQWASSLKSSNHFTKWCHDELVNQGFVTGSDLLQKNYDPNRATVVTFLKAFLWSRVAYAYGKSFGWRYRDSKWRILESSLDQGFDSGYISIPDVEYPESLTEREKQVIAMRIEGYPYQEIAEKFGYRSANTVTYWIRHHIRPKFLDHVHLEEV